MTVEILFPEFCNLFGDMSNMKFLKQCLPDARFVETPLSREPLFAAEDTDLIYMGPMTERTQEKVIKKLLPYKERLRELIEAGKCFLFTGNAMEIMGEYIENEDSSRVEGLGILKLTAKRDMFNRHNSTFLGFFGETPVMGFKSQFTMAYAPEGGQYPLFKVKKGVGLNKKCKTEGILYHNFFGTYLLGPVLIMNPELTKDILRRMGVKEPRLVFEEELYRAYSVRLKDFEVKT